MTSRCVPTSVPSRPPRASDPARPAGELAGERRTRALEERLDVRPRRDSHFLRAEVRNPAHGTRYEVLLPAYPSREGAFCSCEDFARRGIGTCKHVESATLYFDERPEAAAQRAAPPRPTGLWEEIDRRGAEGGPPEATRRLRWAGAALVEAPDTP